VNNLRLRALSTPLARRDAVAPAPLAQSQRARRLEHGVARPFSAAGRPSLLRCGWSVAQWVRLSRCDAHPARSLFTAALLALVVLGVVDAESLLALAWLPIGVSR
jgi:hypothetical protein